MQLLFYVLFWLWTLVFRFLHNKDWRSLWLFIGSFYFILIDFLLDRLNQIVFIVVFLKTYLILFLVNDMLVNILEGILLELVFFLNFVDYVIDFCYYIAVIILLFNWCILLLRGEVIFRRWQSIFGLKVIPRLKVIFRLIVEHLNDLVG